MKKLLALLLALSMTLTCVVAFAEDEAAEAEEPIVATAGDPDDYTYNNYTSTFPTTWNPHTYKTATDNDTVMTYVTDSFFAFDYNETMDSYRMIPMMVAGEPEDVTADFVGEEWGIEEGATGRAWKYTLRDDLKWEDGTPITAQTYVESAKRQLNPLANNYRADSLYSGTMVLHNAEAYAKQGVAGQPTPTALGTAAELEETDIEGLLAAHAEDPGYINWSYSFGDTYDFETGEWTGDADDVLVETPLTLAELYAFYTTGAGAEYATWASAENLVDWAVDELAVGVVRPAVDFENVGIKALSDTEVVFILDLALQGFQLKYNLDVALVNPELYDACENITDGVYTNSYGTSVETTMSYGPYKLTFFQSDREIILEKNENWYGYSLPENEGLYQTTRISTVYIANPETAMEMFLAGQLDSKGLDVNQIKDYGSSEYTYLSEGASVFAMAFNPDARALAANQASAGDNVNKTILTVKEFRMAMSLGIDRAAFISVTSPSNAPAFALYGATIVGDPENATFYRDTDAAKQVIVDFWGLTDEIGEGKLYATIDDAIDSITGYNPDMAKEYFDKAYDIAIAEGLMDEDDVIQIVVGIPSASSAFYNNGYDFIVNNYTEAVTGTKLEGKLTFSRDDTVGNGFGDALRNNQVDMLFGVGWSGSTFDPYSLMEAYVSPNYAYDACWDSTSDELTVELDGVNYTATVYAWYECINGSTIELAVEGSDETVSMVLPYSYDEAVANNRLIVLAALEGVVLQNYDFIPLMNDASLVLKGQQINYYTEEEVFPMGYGGIKYYTYNYTDGEWDAYVQSQGGILNYN